MNNVDRPLVVDLDGTLIKTDLLLEGFVLFFKSFPWLFFMPAFWLFKGKVFLKNKLASQIAINIETLPYNEEVISFIKDQCKNGRTIVLATASLKKYADQISTHLGCISEVIATDVKTNLNSTKKRDALVSRWGEGGYDYIGNSSDDLSVWKASHRAYICRPGIGVRSRLKRYKLISGSFNWPRHQFLFWIKELRLHQWIKNSLIFVPLVAGHMLGNLSALAQATIAFITFGLCASGTYILNDLLDLADDRSHHIKRFRPLSSGAVSIGLAVCLAPSFIVSGLVIAWLLCSPEFTAYLFSYLVLTLTYSLSLKKKVLIDVLALAFLFTLRVIAGAAAIGGFITFWLLAFSLFIFLSLALVKRYSELLLVQSTGDSYKKIGGRGYYPEDLNMVASLGAASGYLSVLVMALYIQDPKTAALYSNPRLIWFACPVFLLWISRIWLLAHRGRVHIDPVLFAAQDKASLLMGGLFGLIFWLAS